MTPKLSTEIVEGIGYKKCKLDRIAKLQILGQNNEKRESIADKRYAKFRANKVKVLEIYNAQDSTITHNEAQSLFDSNVKYVVNDIVKPDSYHPDPENVCSNGIHYYLTEEAAYHWESRSDGLIKTFYDDGTIKCEREMRNNKVNGSYTTFYNNGNVFEKMNFENGHLHGPYEQWSVEGKKIAESKFNYDRKKFENVFL